MTFKLKPLANLRKSPLPQFDWESVYDDPQFWVENWYDFAGCRLSIRCEIKSKQKIRLPLVIYLDDGDGYTEQTATYIDYDHAQVAVGQVEIPLNTRAIRLDPFVQSTYFSIEVLEVDIIGYLDGEAAYQAAKARNVALPSTPPVYEEFDALSLYHDWIDWYEPPASLYPAFKQASEEWDSRPCISLLMPTYNPPEQYFRLAIQSLQDQAYDNWVLCIADDCSPDPNTKRLLAEYEALDSRIKVVYRTENGHISEASNSALAIVETDFVGLMDHDDVLHPLALYYVAEQINKTPEVAIIYSDEDKIDEDGQRREPYFKSSFNYDLFLCQNMVSHFGIYRTDVLRAIGGFRKGFEGSQDYDLVLRALNHAGFDKIVHIPRVLYHWRLHEASTSHDNDAKPYAKLSALAAVKEFLASQNIEAILEEDCFMSVHGKRLRYAVSDPQPSVDIIIPTKNCARVLSTCVQSILDKTSYQNYSITIVDNGSTETDALDLFKSYEGHPRIRVKFDGRDFNFAALNNQAALNSDASLVCFLNNDTEVITPEWLTEMVSLATQTKVGCVGAKLLYPDNTVQHAGVVFGFGAGIAGHPHKKRRKKDIGYFARAGLRGEFSAVTAACLVMRQSLFKSINGFDESLAVAFNDIDLCLKLRKKGLRVVWTPYAELYHHESYTRGYDDEGDKVDRIQKETQHLKAKWGEVFEADQFYSPNHSLFDDEMSYELAHPPRVKLVKEKNDL